jgi:hypothetical protein
VLLDILLRLLPAAMRMMFSGWFNSWATDVAISPSVASLEAWIIRAASALRSLISRINPTDESPLFCETISNREHAIHGSDVG